MTAWAHLPNAKHIDQMLADILKWAEAPRAAQDAAWDAAWSTAWGAAWNAAWNAARSAARGAAWDAAWNAARGAAQGAAWDAARGAVRGAAQGAASALIAYDNCAPLLSYSAQELRALIALTESPAAILLLPRAILKGAT